LRIKEQETRPTFQEHDDGDDYGDDDSVYFKRCTVFANLEQSSKWNVLITTMNFKKNLLSKRIWAQLVQPEEKCI